MQKRDLEKALVRLATSLAEKGYAAEAEQVDSILRRVAAEPTEARKFAISVVHNVTETNGVEKGVASRIVVRPVEGEQVLESKVLFDKNLKARNLAAAQAAIKPFIDHAKGKFAPASFDESIKYNQ